jgi:hypothetical protein
VGQHVHWPILLPVLVAGADAEMSVLVAQRDVASAALDVPTTVLLKVA